MFWIVFWFVIVLIVLSAMLGSCLTQEFDAGVIVFGLIVILIFMVSTVVASEVDKKFEAYEISHNLAKYDRNTGKKLYIDEDWANLVGENYTKEVK